MPEEIKSFEEESFSDAFSATSALSGSGRAAVRRRRDGDRRRSRHRHRRPAAPLLPTGLWKKKMTINKEIIQVLCKVVSVTESIKRQGIAQ